MKNSSVLCIIWADLFEAFELDDENLRERPNAQSFDGVLLILAAVWTQPSVVGTELRSPSTS